MIYHVVVPAEWETASDGTDYAPKAFPQEGFIHCCEFDQLIGVTRRYFANHDEIIILVIEPVAVTAQIKYEDFTNTGVKFPHIYGALNIDAIRSVVRLQRNVDGDFGFPADWSDRLR